MSVIHLAQPPTRREFAYYIFGAASCLMLLLLAGIVLWAALPKPQVFDLGPLESFRSDGPTRKLITLNDGSTLPLWVVHAEEKWSAFRGRIRTGSAWNCEYKWVPTNHRFEDPCSGFKWALSGELLTYFDNLPPDWLVGLHDLDQYSTTIQGGHLTVDANKIIHGETHLGPPPEVRCNPFWFDGHREWLSCTLRDSPP